MAGPVGGPAGGTGTPAAPNPDAPLTFGIAIAVPEPHGAALQAHRASFGDPLADHIPSHITLLPPDVVRADALAELEDRLAQVAARTPRFRVALRGTGTFRPVSPVVFVAVSRGIAESELLADDLRATISAPASAFPYHPHVTVAHHLEDDALDHAYDTLADFACEFDVEQLVLYLHRADAGWVQHRSFALTG